MENNLKVFKSDRFDVEDTSGLSLFFYPNSLYIFAKDKNQANIGIHEYYGFRWDDLNTLIVTDHLLRLDVPAKIYVHSQHFSLVPGVLFLPGNEAAYLSFAGPQLQGSYYFGTALDSNNLQLISSIGLKAKKSLDSRFSELTFHHGAASFLSYLFKERFNLIGQEISVNLFGQHMYIASFTDQELSSFNFYELVDIGDILKYVLILIEQLKYDRNHVRVSVFGSTAGSGVTENWGKSYFRHFRLLTPHANQNYSHGFKHLKSENLFESKWQFD